MICQEDIVEYNSPQPPVICGEFLLPSRHHWLLAHFNVVVCVCSYEWVINIFCTLPSPRLSEELVVRVSDFGLARDVYSSDYYRASHGAKLPVKWMPPETLHDTVSNEKTDMVCSDVCVQ